MRIGQQEQRWQCREQIERQQHEGKHKKIFQIEAEEQIAEKRESEEKQSDFCAFI